MNAEYYQLMRNFNRIRSKSNRRYKKKLMYWVRAMLIVNPDMTDEQMVASVAELNAKTKG